MKRISLLLVLTASSLAYADRAKPCPDAGDILESGLCVKRQTAVRDSTVDIYQHALEELDNKPRDAFAKFDKLCKASHGPSCTQLGLMYQYSRGRVVPKDLAKA